MFEGFEIAKDPSFDKHLNKYNVVSLIIQDFLANAKDVTGVYQKHL